MVLKENLNINTGDENHEKVKKNKMDFCSTVKVDGVDQVTNLDKPNKGL